MATTEGFRIITVSTDSVNNQHNPRGVHILI